MFFSKHSSAASNHLRLQLQPFAGNPRRRQPHGDQGECRPFRLKLQAEQKSTEDENSWALGFNSPARASANSSCGVNSTAKFSVYSFRGKCIQVVAAAAAATATAAAAAAAAVLLLRGGWGWRGGEYLCSRALGAQVLEGQLRLSLCVSAWDKIIHLSNRKKQQQQRTTPTTNQNQNKI